VIASPAGDIYINSTGNPGMATPGMGDALSGIVGAMLGQHMAPLDALALGVFLHGFAADRVATRIGRVGYIAGDLIDELPSALEALTR
jgi:ADP-dependent NAD(P)H-hydrate dehydratase / NAD(P)H-hydrate epimerase